MPIVSFQWWPINVGFTSSKPLGFIIIYAIYENKFTKFYKLIFYNSIKILIKYFINLLLFDFYKEINSELYITIRGKYLNAGKGFIVYF